MGQARARPSSQNVERINSSTADVVRGALTSLLTDKLKIPAQRLGFLQAEAALAVTPKCCFIAAAGPEDTRRSREQVKVHRQWTTLC